MLHLVIAFKYFLIYQIFKVKKFYVNLKDSRKVLLIMISTIGCKELLFSPVGFVDVLHGIFDVSKVVANFGFVLEIFGFVVIFVENNFLVEIASVGICLEVLGSVEGFLVEIGSFVAVVEIALVENAFVKIALVEVALAEVALLKVVFGEVVLVGKGVKAMVVFVVPNRAGSRVNPPGVAVTLSSPMQVQNMAYAKTGKKIVFKSIF